MIRITSPETIRMITPQLEYKYKRRGRALVRDLPALGLRRGARLEPTAALPDVGMFEHTPLPFEATFWVGPEGARLTHSCVLFKIPGVSLDTWAIDIMHTWHLGPIQQLVSLALHFCINSGIFAPRTQNLDASDMQEMSLLTIKSELFLFYKEIRESDGMATQGNRGTFNVFKP